MLKLILDILFPIKCLGYCGRWDVWLCEKCKQKINQQNKTELPDNKYLDGLYYICEYKKPLIQKLIHQLKYNYSIEIADILGRQLAGVIDQEFDYIIPVPLHKKKLCERGFNQAELIAKNINKNIILNNIILRTKNTAPQAQLDEKDRIKNTADAFILNSNNKINLAGKKILLVDDVFTTGNTLGQITKILRQNKAARIWAACVARG